MNAPEADQGINIKKNKFATKNSLRQKSVIQHCVLNYPLCVNDTLCKKFAFNMEENYYYEVGQKKDS